MGKFQDLTGQRFGRLLVVKRAKNNKHGNAMWLCLCDCGNKTIVCGCNLRAGTTQSCGCLHTELSQKRFTTHGLSKTRLYNIWSKMLERCYNKKNSSFYLYGARGIEICEEWKNDFKTFYDWAMLNGYSDELSIDRINVNGNYEPSNCRWASDKEQANNRRTNCLVTHNGKTQTLTQWCEEIGINVRSVYKRLELGWDIEKALFYKKEGATD
jgi:hypothetical protein